MWRVVGNAGVPHFGEGQMSPVGSGPFGLFPTDGPTESANLTTVTLAFDCPFPPTHDFLQTIQGWWLGPGVNAYWTATEVG
jgi:hypothetical protein